ncbi:MAG TPA: hypothetical protein VLX90_06575 [Steroidobacteraceae bacterium]|nr:hypothetical protein [Steroidobacteraceae bacterium]
MTAEWEGSEGHGGVLHSRRLVWLAAALSLALAGGCASHKPIVKGERVAPADVRVYESTDLLRNQYTLVQRVWTDSWRTNISYPSFGSEADGLDAMKRIAADSGANGLIHVICLDGRAHASSSPLLYCYGDAIRVN